MNIKVIHTGVKKYSLAVSISTLKKSFRKCLNASQHKRVFGGVAGGGGERGVKSQVGFSLEQYPDQIK